MYLHRVAARLFHPLLVDHIPQWVQYTVDIYAHDI